MVYFACYFDTKTKDYFYLLEPQIYYVLRFMMLLLCVQCL